MFSLERPPGTFRMLTAKGKPAGFRKRGGSRQKPSGRGTKAHPRFLKQVMWPQLWEKRKAEGTFKQSETEVTPSHYATDKSKIMESRKQVTGYWNCAKGRREKPASGKRKREEKGGSDETAPQTH